MASPNEVDAMAAEVAECPWWPTFGPDEQAIIATADLYVEDRPSELELQLTETGPGFVLQGAMIPPDIAQDYGFGDRAQAKVYYEPTVQMGASPCDVMRHEIGHLPGFDFPHHDEDDCRMCSRTQERRMAHHQWRDDCPVCNTFAHLSQARGLLDYVRFQAHLTHRVPMGLGGCIPGADVECGRAYDELNRAYSMGLLRTREAAAEECAGLIIVTRQALQGTLGPEEVSIADDLCNQAWSLAGDLNWWFWAHKQHPEIAWAS